MVNISQSPACLIRSTTAGCWTLSASGCAVITTWTSRSTPNRWPGGSSRCASFWKPLAVFSKDSHETTAGPLKTSSLPAHQSAGVAGELHPEAAHSDRRRPLTTRRFFSSNESRKVPVIWVLSAASVPNYWVPCPFHSTSATGHPGLDGDIPAAPPHALASECGGSNRCQPSGNVRASPSLKIR